MRTPHDQHIDYVELPSSDVAAGKRFYQSVFGWSYQDWGDEYADTHDSGVSSGLSADPTRTKAPLVVVFVTDLEAAHARVIAAGGNVSRAIFTFPGGRRFHFVDPAGNELAVWTKP